MDELIQWLKKPTTKGDLVLALAAAWLVESGKGEEGAKLIQEKVRGLLGAAPAAGTGAAAEKKDEEKAK